MDISALVPVERTIEIVHPVTKEELGITVSLLSLNDDRMRKIKRKIQDERIRLESKGKSFKSADIEENEIAMVFAAMIGWEWKKDTEFEGEKPAFNIANVKKVLTKLDWFKTQLMEAISEEEAFFQT
jgi:hypothetical protein